MTKKHANYTGKQANDSSNYRKSFRIREIVDPPNEQEIQDAYKDSQTATNDVLSNSYGKYGTWSDWISILVNIVVAGITLLLFQQAVRQNSIAEKNIALADSVFKLSKQAFDSSVASSRQSSDLQNKAIDAQINSFRETEARFKIQNEPYLKVSVADFEPPSTNSFFTAKMKFSNLGKYPAKIIDSKGFLSFRRTPPPFQMVYKIGKEYTTLINEYITDSNPLYYAFQTKEVFHKEAILPLEKGETFLFFTGFVRYVDIIAKQIKQCNYQIKIQQNPYGVKKIVEDNIFVRRLSP